MGPHDLGGDRVNRLPTSTRLGTKLLEGVCDR
jgi:hypothetical protein